MFLDPTFWTGQAGCARACESGTDIIVVGDQQGYDTCYKADTCKAQLEITLKAVLFPGTCKSPQLALIRH